MLYVDVCNYLLELEETYVRKQSRILNEFLF